MTRKIGAMILVLVAIPCVAQSNLLQITSPASGTVVYPNQMLVISVNADPSVSNVAIMGQDPLGFSQTTNGQPLQFQLTIPSNTTIGPYEVSAVGSASNGSLVASPAISLQVDTQYLASLSGTQPSVLRFSAAGDAIPLHVTGLLPDGSQLDITHSVQISYASQNPQIATVDGEGIVTAVALGSTYIVVSNSNTTYNVNTKVGQLATMSFPGLGSMLPGSSVTFQWTGSNTATAYWIDVGNAQGGNNYYQSGRRVAQPTILRVPRPSWVGLGGVFMSCATVVSQIQSHSSPRLVKVKIPSQPKDGWMGHPIVHSLNTVLA